MSKKEKTIRCKQCGAEIAQNAKFCLFCGAKNKSPIYKKPWFIVLIVAVAVVMIAVIGSIGDNESPSSTNTQNETQLTTQVPEISYTVYTVSELIDDLNENSLKAADKYMDQHVELTGRLSVIDSSGKYISIKAANETFTIYNVTCYIKSKEQKDAIMNMSIGDMIVVKGKITRVGEVLGYSLDIEEVRKEDSSASIPSNTNTQSETPLTTQASEISYTVYTVSELIDDLNENSLKAADKYLDQYVELTGRLSVIDSSGEYISIKAANETFTIYDVMCYIKSKEQRDVIMDMSIGDIIVVKGKITRVGEVSGYSLDIDEVRKAES